MVPRLRVRLCVPRACGRTRLHAAFLGVQQPCIALRRGRGACCRHAERINRRGLPTSVLLVLSRTQVHALGGFDVLEVALAPVLGGTLRLGRARGVEASSETQQSLVSFSLQLLKAASSTCVLSRGCYTLAYHSHHSVW